MQKSIAKSRQKVGSFEAFMPHLLGEKLLASWLRRIRFGRLTVDFPSGRQSVFRGRDDGPKAAIKIHNLRLVFSLLASGDIGFAESYMRGDWETPDLTELLHFGAANAEMMGVSLQPNWMVNLMNRRHHAHRANTRNGSRRNIAAHYDLGNAFYEKWLDDSMSYSSALFDDMSEAMETAQQHKYVRLADAIGLQASDRVLEIGCGWGGFAEIAARDYGCKVVCLTLSKEQAKYARARMHRLGLSGQVEVRIQDYRDVEGAYDKIVSIEMFEAVGEAYWKTYLDILADRLKPGGQAALQIITIADDCFDSYRQTPDFIQKYIFPGGMLPSPQVFERAVANSGLKLSNSFYFGKSYAETLRRWDRDFQRNWKDISALGFDARFYALWRYYLCYCEVGFERDQIDVGHFIVEHHDQGDV